MRFMRRGGQTALVFLLAVLAVVMQACATTAGTAATSAVSTPPHLGTQPVPVASPDDLPRLPPDPAGQSRALTDYFKAHRLPLVGASVVDKKGSHQVVLYGFVATPFGKTDAEEVARRILHDSAPVIVNRIIVEPALLASNKPARGVENSSAVSPSDAETLNELPADQSYPTPDAASQYVQNQGTAPDWLNTVFSLVMMIAPLFVP